VHNSSTRSQWYIELLVWYADCLLKPKNNLPSVYNCGDYSAASVMTAQHHSCLLATSDALIFSGSCTCKQCVLINDGFGWIHRASQLPSAGLYHMQAFIQVGVADSMLATTILWF